MLRALPALVLSLALAGCGPKTVASMLFPTRYAVTTVVDFNDGGRVTRQTVVSNCKVIDQTDSIAANTNTDVIGERHWIRRADGSLWVVGLLNVCRWGPKGPRGDRGVFKPFAVDPPWEQREGFWPIRGGYTYRYDDPAAPTEVEMYRTERMFADGAQGLRLSGQLGAAGEAPTDTLRAAFPFLAQVHAAAEAARAKAKGHPSGYRDYSIAPGAFTGFEASATQLRNGTCPAPDPDAEGPIRLEPNAECRYANPCREGLPADRLCETPLGGLRPSFATDFKRVDYTLDDRDPAFVQRLVRTQRVAAAEPPRHSPAWFEWNPQICLDDVCFELERMSGGALLYYPKRNVLVEIRQTNHDLRGELFLAENAPIWSGTD